MQRSERCCLAEQQGAQSTASVRKCVLVGAGVVSCRPSHVVYCRCRSLRPEETGTQPASRYVFLPRLVQTLCHLATRFDTSGWCFCLACCSAFYAHGALPSAVCPDVNETRWKIVMLVLLLSIFMILILYVCLIWIIMDYLVFQLQNILYKLSLFIAAIWSPYVPWCRRSSTVPRPQIHACHRRCADHGAG